MKLILNRKIEVEIVDERITFEQVACAAVELDLESVGDTEWLPGPEGKSISYNVNKSITTVHEVVEPTVTVSEVPTDLVKTVDAEPLV